MKSHKPDLTVIIVSHNSKHFLTVLLDSLQSQEDIKLEIIVVDNNSSDGTIDHLKKKYKHVKTLERNTAFGFSAANNLGVGKARADMLLFLNPDITLSTPSDLRMMVNKYNSLKNIGALGPKVLLYSSLKIDKTCHRGFPTPWAAFTHFSGLERLFPRSPLFSQYTSSYKGYDSEHPIDSIGGMFMLTRKDRLKSVGSWDEDYPLYGEDLDLCYRLKEHGLTNYYWPGVVVYHHKSASTGMSRGSRSVTTASRETTKQVKNWSIEAMNIFYKKHYMDKYPRIVTFVTQLGISALKLIRTGSI